VDLLRRTSTDAERLLRPQQTRGDFAKHESGIEIDPSPRVQLVGARPAWPSALAAVGHCTLDDPGGLLEALGIAISEELFATTHVGGSCARLVGLIDGLVFWFSGPSRLISCATTMQIWRGGGDGVRLVLGDSSRWECSPLLRSSPLSWRSRLIGAGANPAGTSVNVRFRAKLN